nr:MAG TPA: endopeptidase [Caudoviricetes sp.]
MSKFKFMNVNPLGLIEQDCVCRAISLALDVDYKTIERKLESIGY